MATEEIEKYLLSILNDGKVKRNSFINECVEDENRFSKGIKITKIVNFAIKSQKVSKIASIRGTRDIFGRLLYLAVTHGISLEKYLNILFFLSHHVSHIQTGLSHQSIKQQYTIIWSKIKISNHQTMLKQNVFTKI